MVVRLKIVALALLALAAAGRAIGAGQAPGNYFSEQVSGIEAACRTNAQSLAQWEARRPALRREAAEMLGLDPPPPRTDLKPVITGTIDRAEFVVQKLEFQSLPGLYVTANLYLPKHLQRPAPAILYLCGHLQTKTNGIACGSKAAYQHHGIWFARNGYVCLIIDTLEFGEIEGHHKGTYDLGMWWWNARGYTPAGVETWNAMRALDYLDSRPEVDRDRIGVTGRSGGGAYSWFVAALDDRIKAVAPVAGMADLRSYVDGGTVDGHCDCMFFVNTYRWDYPLLAALCAPRPLLMENTDADALFPLEGVLRTHDFVKRVYNLYGAGTNFGLVIAPGPHRDIQDLQVPAMRWFNIHLKHEDPMIDTAAVKMFPPLELRVFDRLPDDQRNTRIEETFVPAAPLPAIPASAAEWEQMQTQWLRALREKCFGGWPKITGPPKIAKTSDTVWRIESERGAVLSLRIVKNPSARRLVLRLENSSDEPAPDDAVCAYFSPRDQADTGIRRRYMLLGQTVDGMRVWDICRAAQALKSIPQFAALPITISAKGNLAVDALYASLFEHVAGLDLKAVPASHMKGPDYLNVLKILDIPETAAMAADNCSVSLQAATPEGWQFLRQMNEAGFAHVKLSLTATGQ